MKKEEPPKTITPIVAAAPAKPEPVKEEPKVEEKKVFPPPKVEEKKVFPPPKNEPVKLTNPMAQSTAGDKPMNAFE